MKNVCLLNAKAVIFHEINTGSYFVTKSYYAYTGLSVTIPANSYFSITARAQWGSAKPDWVGISTSDTAESQTVAEGTAPYAAASCSLSGKTTEAKTYYMWAKYSNESENYAEITGFCVTQN